MKKALLNKSLIYNNKPSLLYDYLHKSILASETTSKLTIEECTNNQ